MYPSAFRYEAPQTVHDALALANDSSKFLAGGQSLIPVLNMHMADIETLIDLSQIPELCAPPAISAGNLVLSALTRHIDIIRDKVIQEHCPMLSAAAQLVGNPRVRNRGTIGGSLSHADPAAELGTALTALGAKLRCASPDGPFEVPIAEFFLGPLTTVLGPQELLTHVIVPVQSAHEGTSFIEFARKSGDFALVAVASRVQLGEVGEVTDASLALGGVDDFPVSIDIRSVLVGEMPIDDVLQRAAKFVGENVRSVGDVFGSSQYRNHLAQVLTLRALREAVGNAALQEG